MDEVIIDAGKIVNSLYKIYYYEFYPRTDAQALLWGEFLKEQRLIALLGSFVKSRRKNKRKMQEINLCIEYNVSQSEYLKAKEELEKFKADDSYHVRETEQYIHSLLKGSEKKMLKLFKKYEKLFAPADV